jgi:hypothetical protein
LLKSSSVPVPSSSAGQFTKERKRGLLLWPRIAIYPN